MAVNWPGAVNVIRDCSGRGGGCLTPAGCEVDRSGNVDEEASGISVPSTDTILNMLLQVVPSRKTFAAHLADGQSSLRVKQSVKLEEWLLRLRMLSGYMLSIGLRGAKDLIAAGKDLLRGSIELRSYLSGDVAQVSMYNSRLSEDF